MTRMAVLLSISIAIVFGGFASQQDLFSLERLLFNKNITGEIYFQVVPNPLNNSWQVKVRTPLGMWNDWATIEERNNQVYIRPVSGSLFDQFAPPIWQMQSTINGFEIKPTLWSQKPYYESLKIQQNYDGSFRIISNNPFTWPFNSLSIRQSSNGQFEIVFPNYFNRTFVLSQNSPNQLALKHIGFPATTYKLMTDNELELSLIFILWKLSQNYR